MTDVPAAEQLSGLISAAVASRMTPDFIEKEVNSRVQKLVVESIDKALCTWSDTGKLIEKAVQDALRVDRLDLPSYGALVTSMLRAQVEANVAPIVAGRLAEDMAELLKLAPKEVKLSEIADAMRSQHDGDAYGEVITVIVDDRERFGSRSTWLYLDEDEHREERDKYLCKHQILLSDDGTIFTARVGAPGDQGKREHIGRSYGLDQKLRAYVACGTKIILDVDAVVTSVGDY